MALGAWGVQAATLESLRCEYRVNPLGIGEREPRLSWTMREDSAVRGVSQAAYQIWAASSPERLARGEADLWDSGRVRSAASIQIVYGGRALAAREHCYWKVRAWTEDGRETAWSGPAFWSMGLLHAADWRAEWLRIEEITPEEAAAPKPPPPKLTVVSAVYGTHDNQQKVDATAKVRELVEAKGGRLMVQASNANFGDPAIGGGKRLEVVYEVGGKQYTACASEGQFVTSQEQVAAEETPRVKQELKPVAVTEPKPGVYVFDFGQNMVGWTRLNVKGEAGTTVGMFFNEMLNPDGTVYRENLHAGKMGKTQSQTDRYTLRSNGVETFEPHFTYHGFRYVEVTGLKSKPDASLLTGRVFHTSFAQSGRFECSDPLVTRLAQNIHWSQRGNMMGIPTDCPQRDERAGWAGDAQFFMPTAVYNFDVAGLFSKWLYDMCEDSFVAGKGFADTAPYYGKLGAGNTGWGDAGVVCPYVLYRTYGDTRVIAAHYAQMKRLVLTLSAACTNFVRGAGAYGDWLNVGGGAKGEVCGTAYQVYLCDLMSEMGAAIGKNDDAATFGEMARGARMAFQKTFFKEDGSILDSSQTGYALAFTMGLVPQEVREKAAAKFKGEVERFKDCVATGFIGTPRLLTGLHAAGLDAEAYRMLLRHDYPSWLYPVTLGATTIWERWDGWRPDKGFQDPNMNSFNHYAFGSCGQYLFKCVGGIAPLEPGYQKFAVAPVIGEGLTWAKTSYRSIYGEIASEWKEAGKVRLDVSVPPNTQALIRLPVASETAVRESGKRWPKRPASNA